MAGLCMPTTARCSLPLALPILPGAGAHWQGDKTAEVIDWAYITWCHLQGDWSKGAPFVVFLLRP